MPAYAVQTQAPQNAPTAAWAARARIQEAYKRRAGTWPALARVQPRGVVGAGEGTIAAGGAVAFIVLGLLALAAMGELERKM